MLLLFFMSAALGWEAGKLRGVGRKDIIKTIHFGFEKPALASPRALTSVTLHLEVLLKCHSGRRTPAAWQKKRRDSQSEEQRQCKKKSTHLKKDWCFISSILVSA